MDNNSRRMMPRKLKRAPGLSVSNCAYDYVVAVYYSIEHTLHGKGLADGRFNSPPPEEGAAVSGGVLANAVIIYMDGSCHTRMCSADQLSSLLCALDPHAPYQ